MFERFTKEAIKVIMLAQEESRRLGHNFVGSEQILLGIIGEKTSLAAKALKHCGVTLPSARLAVEKVLGRGSGFVAVEIPFTPRAKRILEASWNFARSLACNYIAPEHLLAGVLSESGGVALRALNDMGVTDEQVRKELEAIMSLQPGATGQAQAQPSSHSVTAGAGAGAARIGCSWCGESILPDSQLCRFCQRPIGEHSRRCPLCAEILWKGAISCRYCKAILS
jgi:ATP-dependent Clp protease ATP-binding subunit ClpC